MALNNSEQIITEHLVGVIDLASRVLDAQPGSHYQWDKALELSREANRFHDRLGGPDRYTALSEPVNPHAVEEAVAHHSRHYSISQALYAK